MSNKVALALFSLALLIGAALAAGVIALRNSPRPAPIVINTPVPSATAEPTLTPEPIQVYVNGAVIVPDVYVLPPDSRVKQAIEAAGGFSDQANTVVINLAQPLVDGAHIYVPEKKEGAEAPGAVVSEPDLPSRSQVIDMPGGQQININTAGLEELDKLPGVGPAIARKIIDYRAVNGPFQRIDALLEVSGIGEVKFQQIRDLITTGN